MREASIKKQNLINFYEKALKSDCIEKNKILEELLLMQKEDGSWSVIDDYACDSDIRIDFVYFPTYYATATIMNIINVSGMNDKTKEAIHKGLTFAMGRKLLGHGYEEKQCQLQALNIYKNAGMYEFLEIYGEVFKEFNEMIEKIIDGYKYDLVEKCTVYDWQNDYRKQFEQEVRDYEKGKNKYIWYAAYGSNLCYERFMRYINSCTDKNEPKEVRNITIPYNIYFAGKSRTWGDKGVAYLDDTKAGMSWGRMYLITYQQYSEIQRKEGVRYSKRIHLGTEADIPIYTFTSENKCTDINSPDIEYINIILRGLKEAYSDKSLLVLETYLYSRGVINSDDYQIINYIRSCKHGVAINQIVENTFDRTRVSKSVNKLITYGILKQDSRSVANNETVAGGDAVVYTVKEKRELIDMVQMVGRGYW